MSRSTAEAALLKGCLVIPCHPPRLNQLMRGKLCQRMRLEAAWKAIVVTYWNMSVMPKATGKRRVSLTIVLGPRQRGGDPDSYFKALGDALTACGALRGDSKEWVEWGPVNYSRGLEPECFIGLEDLP